MFNSWRANVYHSSRAQIMSTHGLLQKQQFLIQHCFQWKSFCNPTLQAETEKEKIIKINEPWGETGILFIEKSYWISDSRTWESSLKSRYQDVFSRDTGAQTAWVTPLSFYPTDWLRDQSSILSTWISVKTCFSVPHWLSYMLTPSR